MGCVSVCLRFAQRDVAATKVKGFTTEPQRKAKDKWIFSDRQGVFGFIQGTGVDISNLCLHRAGEAMGRSIKPIRQQGREKKN